MFNRPGSSLNSAQGSLRPAPAPARSGLGVDMRGSSESAGALVGQGARRILWWHVGLMLVLGLFVGRAFYVQVVRHQYYRTTALNDQLKQYEIPAARGTISAYDGSQMVPIVLNQKLFTVYADPTYVKDAGKVAGSLEDILGGKRADYEQLLKTPDRRYVVLAKKVAKDREEKLLALKYPGVGAQEQSYRTYPQGALAGQVLGFVNDDGQGTYGIEQSLADDLSGSAGELKAITDASGVPLAASGNNVESDPVAGKDVTLTLDIGIQRQVEQLLAKGVKADKAAAGSVVVLDPATGAVKAMANYPNYDPSKYYDVSDGSLFNNAAVSHPIEVGSIMKTLTTAAALDQGVIKSNSSFYDPSQFVVDGFKITNIEEDGGPGQRNIAQLLNLSLNTGAVWELMQMGGGQLNEKARNAWHDYMINHFLFGKATGLPQTGENPGLVPDPAENGAGIDLTYANTAFGQAMLATPVQMAGALAAVVNGGTYYQPQLVASETAADGRVTAVAPKVAAAHVVSPAVSQAMIPLMQFVVDNHNIKPAFDQDRYMVGGKTGTAQIAKPGGGYSDTDYNGTYLGFVGGDQPQYVIAVFISEPHVGAGQYAGTAAAQPVFADVGHMLIDHGYVTPK